MLTYFETLTEFVLYCFDVEDMDIAILEVRIGSRYNATNEGSRLNSDHL